MDLTFHESLANSILNRALSDAVGRYSMADTELKSIFDTEPDEPVEARLDAEAQKAYKAGRVVPQTKVVEWLKSWGTASLLRRPSSKTP